MLCTICIVNAGNKALLLLGKTLPMITLMLKVCLLIDIDDKLEKSSTHRFFHSQTCACPPQLGILAPLLLYTQCPTAGSSEQY